MMHPATLLLLLATAAGLCQGHSQIRAKRQAPTIDIHSIPKTSFTCLDKKLGEYYADPETGCQVYHICLQGQNTQLYPISFVCPNGTIFNQPSRVCSPYERVDCRLAQRFYDSLHGNPYLRYEDYEDQSGPSIFPLQPARQPEPEPAPQPRPPSRQPPPPRQPPSRQSPSRQLTPSPQAPSRQVAPPPRQQPPATSARQPVAPPRQPPVRPQGTPSRQAPSSPRQPEIQPPPFTPPRSVFQPPVRPPHLPVPATARPLPIIRDQVITSTSQYEYDYEYEYEYDESSTSSPARGQTTRSKREAIEAFSCADKQLGMKYADPLYECRIYRVCIISGKKTKIISFSCDHDKAFDEEAGACLEKDKVQCQASPKTVPKKIAKKYALKFN